MRTAVVMMTHLFDTPILEEFHRMREGLGATDQAFLLSDGSASPPPSVAPWSCTFDYAKTSRRAARLIGKDMIGNTHLAWIDFFEAHPDFDAYWLVEFDMRYSGPWIELFETFRELPFDLLCTHLRPLADEPGWYWWFELRSPGAAPAADQILRGFLPVTRLSRRALGRLRDAVDEGWTGFLEVLVPTVIRSAGFQVADIGGDGPFVPPGFRNRFYTSVSDAMGSLWGLGTMRYRPPIHFPRIMPGRLYHPVKMEPQLFDAGASQPLRACEALGRALKVVREKWPAARNSAVPGHVMLDYLLQLSTGLSASELREALSRMKELGVEESRLEALRRELHTLPFEPGVVFRHGDVFGPAAT